MSIYMSRAELEEISEGLITAYANKFSNRVIQSIDIEHFIRNYIPCAQTDGNDHAGSGAYGGGACSSFPGGCSA